MDTQGRSQAFNPDGRPVNQSAAPGLSAAQEKKMEKAPLMKTHEDRYAPKDAELEGNYWMVILGWLKFSLGPGLLFTFTSMIFMLGYHTCPRVLVGLFFLLFLILLMKSFLLFQQSVREQRDLEKVKLKQEQARSKGQQQIKLSGDEKKLAWKRLEKQLSQLPLEDLTVRRRDEGDLLVACDLSGVSFLSVLEFGAIRRSKTRKFSVFFGFCALAIAMGGTVGTSIHLRKLIDYYSFNNRRHYTNVAPDEPAAAHADASVLVFMEGARPDATRVMGYRRHGHVYCAAPVDVDASHSDQNPLTDIQYWAVGKDCCDKGFTCDDSTNNKARSGLVLSSKTGMDALMKGVLSDDDLHYYNEAVMMGLSKFDITSPKERLFTRFVADIQQAQETCYSDAWWYWWYIQLLMMPLWMTAGLMTVLVGYDEYKDHLGDVKEYALYSANFVA